MGLFGSLIGGNKKAPHGLPPLVESIFEKMARHMEDEKPQNSMYSPQIWKALS